MANYGQLVLINIVYFLVVVENEEGPRLVSNVL